MRLLQTNGTVRFTSLRSCAAGVGRRGALMVAARKRASTPSRAGGRTQLTLSHMHATNGRTEGRESGWVVLEENDTGSRANREGGEGLVTNFKNNAGLERARPGAVTARQDRPPGSTDNGRGTWGHMAQRVPYFLGEEQRFKSLGSCSGAYDASD
ncbi:hypothetical protein J7T55_008205 [Diaporthe amygdali]|uniref:uncharacterized protein n=1 Tax=Phomopsis amygdali TaxID=1214568 RepID=UPI0022FEB92E|nr:uncharacterized protein J7T55_008205 [Diaporthe amygdali]KAJ0121045.1 hypothetical protein J7T55_008205 [Diaporthe amygdali]